MATHSSIPWRRAWQPTPVFLPGESCGQRSVAGYSPWGHTESDTTERTWHAHTRSVCGAGVSPALGCFTSCSLLVPCYPFSLPDQLLSLPGSERGWMRARAAQQVWRGVALGSCETCPECRPVPTGLASLPGGQGQAGPCVCGAARLGRSPRVRAAYGFLLESASPTHI